MGKRGYRGKTVTAFGETHTFVEWADILGFEVQRLRDFVRNGYTFEEAVEKCKVPTVHRRLTVKGVTKSVTEWAKETGVDRRLITNRMDKGYKGEECISGTRIGSKGEGNALINNATKQKLDGQLAEIFGQPRKQTVFKVRWCDRTSHSHRWVESMVEKNDLGKFFDTHYLSRVVVNW